MKTNKRAQRATHDLPHDLVPHPRAREMATIARQRVARLSEDEIRAKVWQFRRAERLFVETAQLANADRQNFCIYPRSVYVDVLKHCQTCARPFVFYANEQRFWYETLRFPVDVDCVDCPPCRKLAHRAKACQHRYAAALQAPRLDAKDMKTFVDDVNFLFEHGLLRNLARVGAIKNRALRELGGYSGTKQLAQSVACAHEAAEMRPGAWRNTRRAA